MHLDYINCKFLHRYNNARELVDAELGEGYFSEHLEVIDHAWMSFSGELVAWASVVIDGYVGILKCVVVHPQYRGEGIAKELTKIRLEYLKNQGCKYVKSYAWVRPDGSCPSCGILEKNGFEVIDELNGYYSRFKHKCPYCDKDCKCSARVYQKEL